MYTLLLLAVTVLTACTIAHPPVIREPIVDPLLIGLQALEPPSRKSRRDKPSPPRWLTPYDTNDPSRYIFQLPKIKQNWVAAEIDHIKKMEPRVLEPIKYETWNNKLYVRSRPATPGTEIRDPDEDSMLYKQLIMSGSHRRKYLTKLLDAQRKKGKPRPTEIFALTPLDEGYFEPTEKYNLPRNPLTEKPVGPPEGREHDVHEELQRRQNRQNPNLSHSKTLVTGDLDKLKAGVSRQQMRIPVSLIPTNLNWLKITKDVKISANGSDNAESTVKPQNIRVLGSEFATGTIFTVGIAAAVGTAIILALLGLALGWYTLSKRAKAAADVDYPAYGVTGPTIDTSGDRKLAHSAQMYHYQHQKQQIIAMERNNVEQRNGSVSDPESEEENEEGDYTVYECPGFATTGDMEVKNPLFSEEPTPATPGKVELVKPQPKE